jgi:predicted GNAT family acetyltransferase
MTEVKPEFRAHGMGAFNLYENGVKQGEMVIRVKDDRLTVYHTEVFPGNEGKGFAKQLLADMVAYAREHHLKVVPLCAFVHARFKRHPDQYADVWADE